MPIGAAVPFIGPALGILGGAFSKSGKQGSVSGTQRQTGLETVSETGQIRDVSDLTRREEELGILGPFREQLIGAFGEELEAARQPVFGEAQQAQFLSQLNELTSSSMDEILSQFARRGATGPQLGAALQDVQLGRAAQAGQFFAQLPFQEAQARFARTTPLLQSGLGFVGRGPTQVTQTGQSTRDIDTTRVGEQDVLTEIDQSQRGPGLLRGLAGGAAGLLGLGAAGVGPLAGLPIFPQGSTTFGFGNQTIQAPDDVLLRLAGMGNF